MTHTLRPALLVDSLRAVCYKSFWITKTSSCVENKKILRSMGPKMMHPDFESTCIHFSHSSSSDNDEFHISKEQRLPHLRRRNVGISKGNDKNTAIILSIMYVRNVNMYFKWISSIGSWWSCLIEID